MKKRFTAFFGLLLLGAALGRVFDGAMPRAAASGGNPLTPCQDTNGDGLSNLTDGVFLLNWLFLGGPPPNCPATGGEPTSLPDTGQTLCYRGIAGQGWVPVPCNEAPCPGQDGAYPRGCPSGNRFIDNLDGTVTDNCTGLMWQRETADANGDARREDTDKVSWCSALAYCENLSFAGHDDWRLPNVRELQSVVDYGRSAPAMDPIFDAISAGYWSSTPVVFQPGRTWGVALASGFTIDGDAEAGFLFILAVRDGPVTVLAE